MVFTWNYISWVPRFSLSYSNCSYHFGRINAAILIWTRNVHKSKQDQSIYIWSLLIHGYVLRWSIGWGDRCLSLLRHFYNLQHFFHLWIFMTQQSCPINLDFLNFWIINKWSHWGVSSPIRTPWTPNTKGIAHMRSILWSLSEKQCHSTFSKPRPKKYFSGPRKKEPFIIPSLLSLRPKAFLRNNKHFWI